MTTTVFHQPASFAAVPMDWKFVGYSNADTIELAIASWTKQFPHYRHWAAIPNPHKVTAPIYKWVIYVFGPRTTAEAFEDAVYEFGVVMSKASGEFFNGVVGAADDLAELVVFLLKAAIILTLLFALFTLFTLIVIPW